MASGFVTTLRAVGVLGVAALALFVSACSHRTLIHDGPDQLSETRSLGDLIAASGERPVHILFVHGIRANGAGTSAQFRERLCAHVGDGCELVQKPPPGPPQRIVTGAWPEQARYVGVTVWDSEQAWIDSQPFVDRYVFRRADGGPIVVDEVNWWPLLFPLKCRFLVAPEAHLSGIDREHVELCGRSDPPYHAWLDPDHILGQRPRSGGGAKLNAALKQQLLNWGLSDAVIALGPMEDVLRRAMNKTFEAAAEFDNRSIEQQEFVIIAESLGSFVVLDAFANPEPESARLRQVVAQTFNLYLFANQFAVLELARLEGLDGDGLTDAAAQVGPLQAWAATPSASDTGQMRQVIAFSDPSDILTFRVPPLAGARVVNIYDRNGFNFFDIVADPAAAHTGHSRNEAVLRTLFALTPKPAPSPP